MATLITKDRTEIHYEDLGKGTPVVLIHGWPASSAMWEYQTRVLIERGFRVIAYDRRGFGKSSQPATGYDYDTLSDDLAQLLDSLDVQGARLVGFSMGGGEVARYLTRYGTARVAKVALISSVVPYLMQTNTNPAGVPEKALNEMISQLKEDRPKFLATFAKQFYGVGLVSHPVSDEILQWTASMAYPASPIATIECVNAFGKTDFRADLKSFTVPTLVVHGTADKTVPMEPTGEAAAKAIPGVVFRKYDGAPHGLFVTHKNQLAEDLMSFL